MPLHPCQVAAARERERLQRLDAKTAEKAAAAATRERERTARHDEKAREAV